MTAGTRRAPRYKTETRHHPLGKVCSHYSTYRLTCDLYDDMRERAGYRCEICRTPDVQASRGFLVVDHLHNPWTIRGLLCYSCNSLMGRYDRYGARALRKDLRRHQVLLYIANTWMMLDGNIRCSPHRHRRGQQGPCFDGCEAKAYERLPLFTA